MLKNDHSDIPLRVVGECRAQLGEAALWDYRTETLFWVDILGKTLFAYATSSSSVISVPLAVQVSALALRRKGGLVAATRDGFAWLDAGTGELEFITDPEADRPGNRFNDGACDRNGNFVAGTMDDGEQTPSGSIYRLAGDLSVDRLAGDYVICNGPAFSLDGQTMYFSDSASRRILAFPYDPASGPLGRPTLFRKLADDEGYPDGVTIDEEGFLWCAHWGGGRLTRFDPAGRPERTIRLPVRNVTNSAFGGPDLDRLFITTAGEGRGVENSNIDPRSGVVFEANVGIRGIPEPEFAN